MGSQIRSQSRSAAQRPRRARFAILDLLYQFSWIVRQFEII
jgi:hypothetical protein